MNSQRLLYMLFCHELSSFCTRLKGITLICCLLLPASCVASVPPRKQDML